MRNAELIIFVVMIVINGGIAVWRKHKQREAARAAKASVPARTGGPEAIDGRQATRRATRSKGASKAPGTTVRSAQRPRTAPPTAPPPREAARTAAPRPAAIPSPLAPTAPQLATTPAAMSPPTGRPPIRIDRKALRQAILLREVLGPPRAIVPHSGPGG